MTTSILEIGIAFIGGGGVQAALQYFLSNRKEDRIDMDRLVAMLKDDNDRLRDDEQKCKERVDGLEKKVLEYKGKVMNLEMRIDQLSREFHDRKNGRDPA